jgi:hypothetical protein
MYETIFFTAHIKKVNCTHYIIEQLSKLVHILVQQPVNCLNKAFFGGASPPASAAALAFALPSRDSSARLHTRSHGKRTLVGGWVDGRARKTSFLRSISRHGG